MGKPRSWAPKPDGTVNQTNIDIKRVDVDGRYSEGMFASRTLGPTEIICSVERPLVLALDSARLIDTCYNCHTQTREGSVQDNLKRCSGCKVTRYCSASCQKLSWREIHKHECNVFHSFYPRILSTSARALSRYVILKDRSLVSQTQLDDFAKCISHVQDISARKDEEYTRMVQEAAATIQMSKTQLELSTLFETSCRIKINAFTLMTSTFDPLGLSLHPLIAKINHSCRPNAYIRFGSPQDTGAGIEVTPLRLIDVDEEITISYVDENKPAQMRQQELSDRYHFHCKCPRCVEEGLEPDNTRFRFSTMEENVLAQVEALMNNAQSHTEQNSPQRLEHAMRLLIVSDWRKQMYPYAQVLQRLIVSYIDKGEFMMAMLYAAMQTFDVDPSVYTVEFHPIALVHLYVLIRLIGAVVDMTQANLAGQELDVDIVTILPDLDAWHVELSERLVEQAAKTYGNPETRQKMFPEAYNALAYGNVSSRMRDDAPAKAGREARMRKALSTVYKRLQDGVVDVLK